MKFVIKDQETKEEEKREVFLEHRDDGSVEIRINKPGLYNHMIARLTPGRPIELIGGCSTKVTGLPVDRAGYVEVEKSR